MRLGFMSIFVKAAIAALKEIPAVNAEIDGDDIVYKNHYDIGVAVGTEQGLVVPVVRDADAMGFAEIEKAIAELGRKRARRQAVARRAVGRHLHDLQWRRLRLAACRRRSSTRRNRRSSACTRSSSGRSRSATRSRCGR